MALSLSISLTFTLAIVFVLGSIIGWQFGLSSKSVGAHGGEDEDGEFHFGQESEI